MSRYVWLEMLGLMHEAEPYGHLVLGGRALDYRTLARVIAVDIGEVKRAAKELEDRGVFSRTTDGVIYSRRMIRDKNRAEISAKHGRSGGNPHLKYQALSYGWVNPPDKPPDKAQKPEARSQKPEEKAAQHVEQPRASDLDKLEAALRQAAGLENSPSVGLFNLAPVLGLLDAGYSLEQDILPIMRAKAKSNGAAKASSWAYFVPAIQDAHGRREAAAAVPRAAHNDGRMPRLLAGETEEQRFRRMWGHWKRGLWPMGWGPQPGFGGCQIPRELIAQWSQEEAA
jgi:hypothetical protein